MQLDKVLVTATARHGALGYGKSVTESTDDCSETCHEVWRSPAARRMLPCSARTCAIIGPLFVVFRGPTDPLRCSHVLPPFALPGVCAHRETVARVVAVETALAVRNAHAGADSSRFAMRDTAGVPMRKRARLKLVLAAITRRGVQARCRIVIVRYGQEGSRTEASEHSSALEPADQFCQYVWAKWGPLGAETTKLFKQVPRSRCGFAAILVLLLAPACGCTGWNTDRWSLDSLRDKRAVDIEKRLSRDQPIVQNPFARPDADDK